MTAPAPAMPPAQALAQVLVDELVRGGVREAVLSPGSRNAPLSYALQAADAAGRLRLHVRIDERSAAFLALGLAKASGRPVPVACTSGTAAANLHPAVLEASHAAVPLVVLTADRPPELRGTGANQVTDQVGMYGPAVRLFVEPGVPEARPGQVAHWRSVTCRALAAAAGALSGDPGPVQLNLALRDPLVPVAGAGWVEPLDGRDDGVPWTRVATGLAAHPRTLVVVGDTADASTIAAAAARAGWPVVAEPSANAPGALRYGGALLADRDWLARHRPARVVVAGRPTLSRAVAALTARPDVEVDVLPDTWRYADPTTRARRVLVPGPLEAPPGEVDPAWLATWRAADAAAGHAATEVAEATWPSGPAVAAAVVAALPPGALLVLGSSNPVRDVDRAAGVRDDVRVLANRGLAGIDGVVSTAVGAALASPDRPAYALLGDLTFLHDSNGLLAGPREPRPDLTLVVVDDDGGGIFSTLEQGAVTEGEEAVVAFDRVFGTPTGADLAAVCVGARVGHVLARTAEELREALAEPDGLRVVQVRVDRAAVRAVGERLRAAVSVALAALD